MNKTIGIMAHVDAGKTTFAEQLLYHTRSIRQRGRVDHKDAYLDSHEIERARGITVFADQAVMQVGEDSFDLIDTPGHADFSAEMERALYIMDYAILVISAVEGIEAHTETVWELLRSREIPVLIFINKTDRPGADAEQVLREVRTRLAVDSADARSIAAGRMIDEALAAHVAEREESMLDRYMAECWELEQWRKPLRKLFAMGRLVPCLSGSALQDEGVTDFLRVLSFFAGSDAGEEAAAAASIETQAAAGDCSSEPFGGRVYKIRHDANGVRITFLKVTQGTLKVRDELHTGRAAEREKVTQLRIYSGSRYEIVNEARVGQLVAVTGLSGAEAGDGLGALSGQARLGCALTPALSSKVMIQPALQPREALNIFRLLDAEDPALNVSWNEQTQDIQLQVMGLIQLEVLVQLVRTRFGLEVSFGAPEILYKETIELPVIGSGHFEPLGHYAEVHLQLAPGEPGSGLQLRNGCHVDQLALPFQRLVLQHLQEREHHGVLTGAPVTDMTITLLNGRAHNKHTSGGDFREATLRALRQGLEKTACLLLEPYYTVNS